MTVMSQVRHDLLELAKHLRHFHSAMLDQATLEYQHKAGQKPNPFELFNLVTSHPDFQWLRPLSGLMATLDEVIDSKALLSSPHIRDIDRAIAELFSPLEPQFKEFRVGYTRVKTVSKVQETEAQWRNALSKLRKDYLEGELN